MSANTFDILAPAKINLFLHVTGKRDDGYHTLQSAVTFTNIGDRIEFSPYDSFLIDVEGPFAHELHSPQDNMVYKAARILADEYKKPLLGKITLQKNLPVAAGMGGGSSDAATTLIGLYRLWRLPEEYERLQKVGRKLGADVPACIIRKTVWTESIGEKMTRLADMPELHVVLVNPLEPLLTADVFRNFRGKFSPPLQFMGRKKTYREWVSDLKIYKNDLTDSAAQLCPSILEMINTIAGTTGCLLSRMTGSGATCFGVYETAEEANAAAHKIQHDYPHWWCVSAKTVS